MVTDNWRWQGGVLGDGVVLGATLGINGSSLLAGYANVHSSAVSITSRDWMAANLGAGGTLQWRWQGGPTSIAHNIAAAMGNDGSVVMAETAQDQSGDFAAVKLDEDGGLLWEWQDGTTADDTVHTVALAKDGSVILAGSTTGAWGKGSLGSEDFAASKLDAEGNLLWAWQDGTETVDCLSSAVVDNDDDSVVFAGYSSGNWSGISPGGADCIAVKLDTDGNELWRWQSEMIGSDACTAAVMGQNGSMVLAGMTKIMRNSTHTSGYLDLAAIKLDSSGQEVWRWKGDPAKAVAHNPAAIAVGHLGEIFVTNSTAGLWSEESIGGSDFVVYKLHLGTSSTLSPFTGLPFDADVLVTPALTPAQTRTTGTRSSVPPPAVRPPASPSFLGSPGASQRVMPLPKLRSSAVGPIPPAPTPDDHPATFKPVLGVSVLTPIVVVVPQPPLSTQAKESTPTSSGAIWTIAPTIGQSSGTDSVIKPTPTRGIQRTRRMLTTSLADFTQAPLVSSSAPTSPEPTPTSASPAPASRAPTSPAPTSLASTLPSPLPSAQPHPAPTPQAPTSQAPTPPVSSSAAPNTEPPASPAPTSRPTTSPAPTLRQLPTPSPTSTPQAPTSSPASSPATPAPTLNTPAPAASVPPSPAPTSLPSSLLAPTLSPGTSPPPTSLASSQAASNSPPPKSPAPTSLPLALPSPSPAPRPPISTSPAGGIPVPTSSPSISLAPETLAPTSLATTSPSTLPAPTSPVQTPPAPESPTPAPLPSKEPTAPQKNTPASPPQKSPLLPSSTPPPQGPSATPRPSSGSPAGEASPSPLESTPTPVPPAPVPSLNRGTYTPAPAPSSPPPSPPRRATPTPATRGPIPSPQPSLVPLSTSNSSPAHKTSESVLSTVEIGVVCAALGVAAIIAGVCLCVHKRQKAKKKSSVQVAPYSARLSLGTALDGTYREASFFPVVGAAQENTALPRYLPKPSDAEFPPEASCPPAEPSPAASPPAHSADRPPAIDIEMGEEDALPTLEPEYKAAIISSRETLRVMGSFSSPSGNDVAHAVAEAGRSLALNSHFPGVCEAATLVLILINLVSDEKSCSVEAESRIKRCRLVIMILQRASMVLGKGKDVKGDMERMLIEDVQTAVGDMVELIKTYRSKGRISQVIVSTMFKRRMEEAEAVIDRAISDLKLGLHVHSEVNQAEDRQSVRKHWRNLNQRMGSLDENGEDTTFGLQHEQRTAESIAESMASARRLRRQRNLSQIEIPEDHVTISEELLGKGGFGSVYIADYNGRNAAAKVVNVNVTNVDLSSRHGDGARVSTHGSDVNRQRASLLSEVQTMMRLRSPHTVNVYGAITSGKERLVLVMELLTGGDLRCFLRHAEERLPQPLARQIIGDVCVGMAFLHSKNAVHGDLKSPNILLDGEGRAKIADFGTSRWAQRSDSTGLATYRSNAGHVMQMMSSAWAAPEVLYAKGSSYASDVYSFGVVAWEVLSMEVPWDDEALPLDIYRRVVFKGDRPVIPADAPTDIADIVRECWAGPPGERPTSSELVTRLTSCNPQW